MTTLTTHVIDVARGVPAAGIDVRLYRIDANDRTFVAGTVTNADGRTDAPLARDLDSGTYEIVFDVGAYFARDARDAFYGDIPVRFTLGRASPHHHVPLLLSPFGYSTYRGS